jgi:hypothetical protein
MGIFQRKDDSHAKSPIDETSDGVQKFFDGYFADLRERGKTRFEKSIEETAETFKSDLDATITKADAELKAHITRRLDDQISENSEIITHAQEEALKSLTTSAQELKDQHEKVTSALRQNVSEQQELLSKAFEENQANIVAMKQVQEQAQQMLLQGVQSMQAQQQQLMQSMQQNVAAQEEAIVVAFEENMARIVEHYLLGALGDQFDLKTQLPSIIKQMEANKTAMVEDMKL